MITPVVMQLVYKLKITLSSKNETYKMVALMIA